MGSFGGAAPILVANRSSVTESEMDDLLPGDRFLREAAELCRTGKFREAEEIYRWFREIVEMNDPDLALEGFTKRRLEKARGAVADSGAHPMLEHPPRGETLGRSC